MKSKQEIFPPLLVKPRIDMDDPSEINANDDIWDPILIALLKDKLEPMDKASIKLSPSLPDEPTVSL
jgi:hypothetical protein